MNGSNSNLNITDNGSISGNVSATNGNINLNAETVDLSLNSAVTGTISGSNYDINASANGSSNTISIDKAISGVSAINIAQNTDTVITDVAMNSTNSNINVDSNSNLTLRNTSSADMTMQMYGSASGCSRCGRKCWRNGL